MRSFNEKLTEEWNRHCVGESSLPAVHDLLDFVRDRHVSMKYTAVKHASSTAKTPTQSKKSTPSKIIHNVTSSKIDCPSHNWSGHPLSRCRQFWDLDVDRMQKIVREAKLCYNCLSYDHTSKGCASRFNCRHCGAKHHSALHKGMTGKESSPPKAEETKALHVNLPTSSLLSTAMALANHNGACQKSTPRPRSFTISHHRESSHCSETPSEARQAQDQWTSRNMCEQTLC